MEAYVGLELRWRITYWFRILSYNSITCPRQNCFESFHFLKAFYKILYNLVSTYFLSIICLGNSFFLYVLYFCHVNIPIFSMCSFISTFLHCLIFTFVNSWLTLCIYHLSFRIQITYHFYPLINVRYLLPLCP